MIEDMQVRNLSPQTQATFEPITVAAYIEMLARKFMLLTSPMTAPSSDIRCLFVFHTLAPENIGLPGHACLRFDAGF
jgi:hypothetical protein